LKLKRDGLILQDPQVCERTRRVVDIGMCSLRHLEPNWIYSLNYSNFRFFQKIEVSLEKFLMDSDIFTRARGDNQENPSLILKISYGSKTILRKE
jgi:hypothetical protein